PTERFRGVVRQIRNAPQTVQNVVTYDAVIDVDNSDLRLKPGMTANVTFIFAEKDDVLRVPNAALRFRPPVEGPGPQGRPNRNREKAAPDRRTVWVLRQNQAQSVPIRIGITDGTITEVLEGDLKVGDPVITELLDASANRPPASSMPFRGGRF